MVQFDKAEANQVFESVKTALPVFRLRVLVLTSNERTFGLVSRAFENLSGHATFRFLESRPQKLILERGQFNERHGVLSPA
ncbi:MAG: hypothetical protein QM775_00360 [Pirellulales bacterium]